MAIWWAARVASSTRAAIAVAPVNTASIEPTRSSRWRPAVSSGAISDRLGHRCRAERETRAHHHEERNAGAGLGDRRRPGRSGDAEFEAEHEHDLDRQVGHVGRNEDDERRSVVRRSTVDALRSERDQDERHTERSDLQVLDRELEHVALGADRRCERPGAERSSRGTATTATIPASHIACTPDVGCLVRPPGAQPVRDPLGGAVGQEVRPGDHQREQRDGDGEPGELVGAEPSDDRGVDEAVQRLGGQRARAPGAPAPGSADRVGVSRSFS